MPKKKEVIIECCKCQAWDIATAADIERTDDSTAIIGACLRHCPQVVVLNGAISAAWPITEEDKGCCDIIWKEEYK